MQIKGWVKSTLIDYPDRIATTLFTGGCNFRCPHCQNSDLVLSPQQWPDIDQAEIWKFLTQRQGLLDGVVISGGEPTLQPDLEAFIRQVRTLGYAVKLDTNGYRPQVLARLLEQNLLDYVAMDIKAPPARYAQLAGIEVNLDRIQQSIDLLRQSRIEYEFRTTVVPELLDRADIIEIAHWIQDAPHYYLQQFVPHHTLDPHFETISPYPPDELTETVQQIKTWMPQIQVRGI